MLGDERMFQIDDSESSRELTVSDDDRHETLNERLAKEEQIGRRARKVRERLGLSGDGTL